MCGMRVACRWLVAGVVAAIVTAASASAQQRVVTLTAADGLTLKGTLFSPSTASSSVRPGVLLLHQCNRQRAIWDGLAQRLAAAGVHVLTFDLRGFGQSAGPRYETLPAAGQVAQQAMWPADIDVAFQFLLTQPGVLRTSIGVGGASCGVNNAINTARRHVEVKSLVLLSGTSDLEGRRFLRTGRRVPALLAVADHDEFPASVFTTQWLYGMTATPEKKLVHYATGGHGADMFAPHPELMSAIVDWFRATLSASPRSAPLRAEPSNVAKEYAALALLDEPGGPGKIARQVAEARRRDPNARPFDEGLVNNVGYEYLQSGDAAHAVEVFALNVIAFPKSPNVYDSLADGYLAKGDRNLARRNAQKAIDLLSSATDVPKARRESIRASAEKKLKELAETSK
jgi:dienelactone hydrolase